MMTLDLMGGYGRVDEQVAIQEAAAAGLRGMEHLILRLSQAKTGERSSSPPAAEAQRQQLEQIQKQQLVDCREITDMTVSKFKKVISILNRTGHARFRRGPVVAQSQAPGAPETARSAPAPASRPVTLDFTKSVSEYSMDSGFSLSGASSSFLSSVTTGDGSVSNGRGGGSSSLILPPALGAASCGKPPLSSSGGAAQKRKCHGHAHSENVTGGKYGSNGGRCHCSKRRSVSLLLRIATTSSLFFDGSLLLLHLWFLC